MTTTDRPEVPLNACDLSAITPDELEGSVALAKRLLFKDAQEGHELANGCAWQLRGDQYSEACQFIDYDRSCCSMYTHTLEVTPAHGPIWLRVTTDNEELKASLRAEIAMLRSEAELLHSTE